MHTETFPYLHNFPQESQHPDDFAACTFPPPHDDSMMWVVKGTTLELWFCVNRIFDHGKPIQSTGVTLLLEASALPVYDFGVEGDLFKAPELILEEPIMDLDPMTAAVSLISCGGEGFNPQDLKMPDTESPIDFGQLLDEVFYECSKDILAKEETEQMLYEVLDAEIPVTEQDQHTILESHPFSQGPFHKSISSECLSSMDTIHETSQAPKFLDWQGLDFSTVYGMRRAFSEGDLKSLGYGNTNHTSAMRQDQIFTCCSSEDRMEKLLRYRNKKAKRNFGRKIKYACRKALADTQPRIRGRFAKTEEMNGSKKQVCGGRCRAGCNEELNFTRTK